ncbi:hypothetical protein [Pediococcus parvulus]|uniref:hypothetical protein n=1 Tax=Pediococcus parvulus TaxID=54062 RepID=UPI0007106DE0|nr:hypothetical protein [Pediococcus parvulus]MCT3027335.1 hypothetical protein [Pediococcus parvulus]GEL89315.1 hypothetical protein PPA04_05460 [Pediococcus parvulus]GHC07422.1 hypothetical protein GCM10008912_08730 [Pediococcus parvulus]
MAKVYNLEPITKKVNSLKPFSDQQRLVSMTKTGVNSHNLKPMYEDDPDKWHIFMTTNNIDYNKPAYERDWNIAERTRILRQWRTLDSNLSELPEEELKLIQSFYIRFSYLNQSEQALLIKTYHSKEPRKLTTIPRREHTLLQKIVNKLGKFKDEPRQIVKK